MKNGVSESRSTSMSSMAQKIDVCLTRDGEGWAAAGALAVTTACTGEASARWGTMTMAAQQNTVTAMSAVHLRTPWCRPPGSSAAITEPASSMSTPRPSDNPLETRETLAAHPFGRYVDARRGHRRGL